MQIRAVESVDESFGGVKVRSFCTWQASTRDRSMRLRLKSVTILAAMSDGLAKSVYQFDCKFDAAIWLEWSLFHGGEGIKKR